MSEDGSRPSSKVARVIEEYDLEGYGAELEAAWTGEAGDRTSLRDLADEFNQQVLDAAIRESGGAPVSTEVESTYRTLTSDDVPEADRMRKRRELEREGVDIDAVLNDFVTHQAVHTYLTDYREASLPDRSADVLDRKAETLERLQGRTTAVAESTLETLTEADEVTDREYELFVDVRVVCGDCGTDYSIGDLLRQGGCDCGTA
ncbi:MAG: rod-determining factor RdfA [Halopenitus sp.]